VLVVVTHTDTPATATPLVARRARPSPVRRQPGWFTLYGDTSRGRRRFRAHMLVALVNDGPVTVLVET